MVKHPRGLSFRTQNFKPMSELNYIEKIIKWLKTQVTWSLIFTISCFVLGAGILLYGFLVGFDFDEKYLDTAFKFSGALIGTLGSFPVLKTIHRFRRIDMFLHFKSVLEHAAANDIQNDEITRIKKLVWEAINEMTTLKNGD